MSNKHNLEEVDLGNIFQTIGKGIIQFFNWLFYLFQSLFHRFIQFSLFIKKNALKLILAGLLGLLLGLLLNYLLPTVYHSSMIVETNYGSAKNLYKKVQFLDNIIKEKNWSVLAKELDISEEKAQTIKSIEAEIFEKNKNQLTDYAEFLRTTDSLVSKNITKKEFNEARSQADFRYHQLTVFTKSQNIFKNLSEPLLSGLKGDYFEGLKNRKLDELRKKEEILAGKLAEIDSLRVYYRKAGILEASNKESGATLAIQPNQSLKLPAELSLFELADDISKQLSWLNDDKAKYESVYKVVSDFDSVGTKGHKLKNSLPITCAALLMGLVFVFLALKSFNYYLTNYQKP